MRENPSDKSEMVNQILFGEIYEILRADIKFSLVKLNHDGYEGWICNKQVTNIEEQEYINLKNEISSVTTDIIDNSYKINNGIPKPIWVIGSGGVNTAAAANIITTTYFLLSFRKVELTTPILANKLNTTGNWKLNPKAKISFITNDKYSFTLASNWIGKFVAAPKLSKDKKNFIAKGIIR